MDYKLFLAAIASLAIVNNATFAAPHPHQPVKASRGFYIANLSNVHDMDITYEVCKGDDCDFRNIRIPRVNHGKNMLWVTGASYIYSITEIDDDGNAGKETIMTGCEAKTTLDTFTNMVAIAEIPGTNMIGCTAMVTHDPSRPLGE